MTPDFSQPDQPTLSSPNHVFVVISHREARVFHSDAPGAPAEPVVSHAARYLGHAADSKDFARGKENPSPGSFFEPLAAALQTAHRILLLGGGSGHGSEMDGFKAWLEKHHADLAKRIVGAVVIDEHHLTDGQLRAKAREFYALHPGSVR
jgi:hypothetical protein